MSDFRPDAKKRGQALAVFNTEVQDMEDKPWEKEELKIWRKVYRG